MPNYDYHCSSCNKSFEAFQSMSAPHLEACPLCSHPSPTRLIGTGSGLVFKGSGFYQNDVRPTPSTPPSSETKPNTPTSSHSCGSSCPCC